MALSSIVAQTYENWECVVVDDGSRDNSGEIAASLTDGRFRIYRLDRNRGRGFARQKALEEASGELLCMLDADDWLYPDKIRMQVSFIQESPNIALVSNSMAIVDPRNDLVGVRPRQAAATSKINPPLEGPARPPLPYPASMIRMDLAKRIGYDLRFLRSEDADLLLRLLLSRSWAMLPEVAYAYAEDPFGNLKQTAVSYRYERMMFRKHAERFPWQCRLRTAESILKTALVAVAFSLGLGKRLVRRRSSPPGPSDRVRFLEAKSAVGKLCSELFGSSPN